MERKDGKSQPAKGKQFPSRKGEKKREERAVDILKSEKEGRETVQTSKRKEKKKIIKKEGLAVAKLQNIELTTIISPTISVFQDR